LGELALCCSSSLKKKKNKLFPFDKVTYIYVQNITSITSQTTFRIVDSLTI